VPGGGSSAATVLPPRRKPQRAGSGLGVGEAHQAPQRPAPVGEEGRR
ncbi:hypothetical protein MUK42_06752, partial [Musa troglodytarum]